MPPPLTTASPDGTDLSSSEKRKTRAAWAELRPLDRFGETLEVEPLHRGGGKEGGEKSQPEGVGANARRAGVGEGDQPALKHHPRSNPQLKISFPTRVFAQLRPAAAARYARGPPTCNGREPGL